jgi:hypothetical protein
VCIHLGDSGEESGQDPRVKDMTARIKKCETDIEFMEKNLKLISKKDGEGNIIPSLYIVLSFGAEGCHFPSAPCSFR